MSNIPGDLRYTKEHEWLRLEGDVGVIGITDFAQKQLGEVIYVELPEVGKACAAMENIIVVESVKSASDSYAPLAGKVIEINEAVNDDPALINNSPYGEGWLIKLQLEDPGQVDSLLTPEQYSEIAKEE